METDLKPLPLGMSKKDATFLQDDSTGPEMSNIIKNLFSNALHSLYILKVCLTFGTFKVLCLANWERT